MSPGDRAFDDVVETLKTEAVTLGDPGSGLFVRILAYHCRNSHHDLRDVRELCGGEGPDGATHAIVCDRCGARGWRYLDAGHSFESLHLQFQGQAAGGSPYRQNARPRAAEPRKRPLRCRWGWHAWLEVWTRNPGSPVSRWIGHECSRCGEKRPLDPGETW